MNTDSQCVRSLYLKPSGDLSSLGQQSAVLVLDTDLAMEPGRECEDIRLGDLLVSLDDMIEMGRLSSRTDIDTVEIRCMPVGRSVETTYRAH